MLNTRNTMTKAAAALLLAGAPIGVAFAADSNDWDWSLTPYAWLPAIGANIHIDVPPIDTGGTNQFSACAPKLGFTIPLHLEGQGDDFGLLSDMLYLPLMPRPRRRFISAPTRRWTRVSSSWPAYGVPAQSRHEGLEVIGGLRYLWASVDFKLIPNNPELPSGKVSPEQVLCRFHARRALYAKLVRSLGLTLRGDGSCGSTDGTYGADGDVHIRDKQRCVGIRLPVPETEIQRQRPRPST